MVSGHVFCTLVTLLNILHLIETASANGRTERYAGLHISNVDVNFNNLTDTGKDASRFVWCFSRDIKFRHHVGLGSGKAFCVDHRKKSNMAFCLALLLICGDISSNPVPGTADMFSDIKEQLRGNGIKIVHINVRGLMSKLTDVTLLIQEPKLDILVVTETHLDSSISDDTIKIEGCKIVPCNFIDAI